LVLLFLAALGPLMIVIWYSFLTANDTGGIIREFSIEGWKGIFLTYDIFEEKYALADAHLIIFWRSVWLSLATTVADLRLRLPDGLVHRDPTRQRAGDVAVPDHHSVLDQPSDPHLRDQRGDPERRHPEHHCSSGWG